MTTYSVAGYDVTSGDDHSVQSLQGAKLSFVAATGNGSLKFDYFSSDQDSAAVSLGDYNILLNGTHLNDGELPERVEIFDLSWEGASGPKSAVVLNLAFETDEQWRDCMFAVGKDSLPMLSDANAADAFFANARFSKLDPSETQANFAISMPSMPEVEIKGVVHHLFEQTIENAEADDQFEFSPSIDATDEVSDFDLAMNSAELAQFGNEAATLPANQDIDSSLPDLDDAEEPIDALYHDIAG